MNNLIRGEAIKLRSTRTAIGFTIAGVALMLLVVLVSTLADDPSSVSAKRDSITVAPVFILFVVFGVVGATGEYRHRTVAPAILIAPDRLRLLVARTLAYAVTAAGVALVMLVVAFAIGIPLMAGNEGGALDFADYAGLLGGGLLSAALGGVVGVGFGALVGNQVAGVVSVLVYLFVVDSLIGVAESDLIPYTIGTAAPALGGLTIDEAFGFLGSLGVLAAWAAVFMAAGLARESRREVT
ncbi:MAG TPA: hypothetical protein VEX39_05090 [Thermoleophilaceae bacterium]|nr:hypothetical protein [Thermoleophilaceae bacterium]